MRSNRLHKLMHVYIQMLVAFPEANLDLSVNETDRSDMVCHCKRHLKRAFDILCHSILSL